MLLADVQYETLARSLLIAAVLVLPYGIYKVREVRSHRRELAEQVAAAHAAANPPATPPRPRLSDVIAAIDALGSGQGDPDAATPTITIPADVTIDGGDPPAGLVDVLVRDALRRSGLVATAEVDTPAGRVLEVRRNVP